MCFEIKEKTGAKFGNISVLIDKLKQVEYFTGANFF